MGPAAVERPPRYLLDQRVPLALGSATAVAAGALAALTAEPSLLLAAAMPAGAAVALFRLGRDRAEAFARAWRRWPGPSELLFTHRSEAGRDALALAGSQPVDYETSARRVWV